VCVCPRVCERERLERDTRVFRLQHRRQFAASSVECVCVRERDSVCARVCVCERETRERNKCLPTATSEVELFLRLWSGVCVCV